MRYKKQRGIHQLFRVLATLAALVSATYAISSRAEESTYPVWVSPELAPFDIHTPIAEFFWGDAVWLRDKFAEKPEILAETCKQLLEALDDGLEVIAWRNAEDGRIFDGLGGAGTHYSFVRTYLSCRILGRLARARPARVSFVRDFVLDEHASHYLTPFFAIAIPCEEAERQYDAHERGEPWGEKFVPLSAVDQAVRDNIELHGTVNLFLSEYAQERYASRRTKYYERQGWPIYDDGYFSRRISIQARADFDGDGLEDLALFQSAGVHGHSFAGFYGYFITRDTSDGVMRELYPDEHVCEGYRR